MESIMCPCQRGAWANNEHAVFIEAIANKAGQMQSVSLLGSDRPMMMLYAVTLARMALVYASATGTEIDLFRELRDEIDAKLRS